MKQLPSTIHIDFDGTLFDTYYENEDGKLWYVCTPKKYSIEVTRYLSRMGINLVCITLGSNSEYGTLFADSKKSLLLKHFPWFSGLIAVPKYKQDVEGVKFLIDDTACYLDDDKIDGIYLAPIDMQGDYVSERVQRATDWLGVARCLELI